jgi:hypothetical protein
MSTVNLGSRARRSGLVTYLFALFVFGHVFALAQDSPDEITKHQLAESSEREKIVSDEMSKYEEQYSRLFDEYTKSLSRMANSVESNAAISILSNVGNDLDRMNSDFSTLRGYMHLTGMVTRKQFLPDAMNVVTLQRTTMIKRTRVFRQFIEQSLHLSKDQETTRLLLDARDLFRSSAEFLDRLQVIDSTPK